MTRLPKIATAVPAEKTRSRSSTSDFIHESILPTSWVPPNAIHTVYERIVYIVVSLRY
jgi:hypothetical protein